MLHTLLHRGDTCHPPLLRRGDNPIPTLSHSPPSGSFLLAPPFTVTSLANDVRPDHTYPILVHNSGLIYPSPSAPFCLHRDPPLFPSPAAESRSRKNRSWLPRQNRFSGGFCKRWQIGWATVFHWVGVKPTCPHFTPDGGPPPSFVRRITPFSLPTLPSQKGCRRQPLPTTQGRKRVPPDSWLGYHASPLTPLPFALGLSIREIYRGIQRSSLMHSHPPLPDTLPQAGGVGLFQPVSLGAPSSPLAFISAAYFSRVSAMRPPLPWHLPVRDSALPSFSLPPPASFSLTSSAVSPPH